jgi:hypothetical protein
MRRTWETLGRTDRIALLGVIVTFLGILPAYLVFFSRSDDSSPTTTTATTIATTKVATDETQALSVRIPGDWGFVSATFNSPFRGKLDVGAGILAGGGVSYNTNSITFSDPNIGVTASYELAKRLQFSGRPKSDLINWTSETERLIDWSKQGCVFVGEQEPVVRGFVGTARVWENCNGLESSLVHDYTGVSREGEVVLTIQILLPPRSPRQIADDIFGSVVVRKEKVPRGAPHPASPTDPEVATPHWLQS